MNVPHWLARLWRWIGLTDKTLWDYLQLLIVPTLLAVLGVVLNEAANDRQRRDAEERYQQEVLKDYTDALTGLLLEKDLRSKKSGDPVADLARAYTLNALYALDSRKKRSMVRLLYGTDLIKGQIPIIYLQVQGVEKGVLAGVDLSGMYLRGVNLVGVDLRNADLNDTTLSAAFLAGANLSGANLREARLWRSWLNNANLEAADFFSANLIDTNLDNSRLDGVILTDVLYSEKTVFPQGFDPKAHGAIYIGPDADLQDAQLKSAFLRFVNLENAGLRGANLSAAQLQMANLQSADLTGANLEKAHLQKATLMGAVLTDADLTEADLTEADLTEADLTDAGISAAHFCRTVMPDGSINNKGCPEDPSSG